jgi:hypothetical protein
MQQLNPVDPQLLARLGPLFVLTMTSMSLQVHELNLIALAAAET